MDTLGIHTAPDAMSACLVRDGVLVAAVAEQCLADRRPLLPPPVPAAGAWPARAIDFCLTQGRISAAYLDHVALVGPVPESPADLPAAQRALLSAPHPSAFAPGAARPTRNLIDRWCALEAAASLAAPMARCAVLLLDGMVPTAAAAPGTVYGLRAGRHYRRIGEVCDRAGIGLLQASVARHLGFSGSPFDGRLTALAACGRPGFVRVFRNALHYLDCGRYAIRIGSWHELLGPARLAGQPLEQRHMDIAHSFQQVLEETVLAMAQWLHHVSGEASLCLAGSITANSQLNAALRERSAFKEVWVPPTSSDAGCAVGAAMLVDAEYGKPQRAGWEWTHPFTGPSFSSDDVERVLVDSKLAYRQCADIASACAALLAQDKIIGWFQGAAEFGDRSLGARSILAAPFDRAMHERIEALKGRDDVHRPAAVVAEECAPDWFECGKASPSMSFVDHVKPALADRLRGACHLDGSVHLQTVARTAHCSLHEVVTAFAKETGVPVLVHRALKRCGEPTVQTPAQALALFGSSALDALAIGPFLLEKSWLTAWRGRAS